MACHLNTTSYHGPRVLTHIFDGGIRTSKTVNGFEHVYRLSGRKIETEEWDGNLLVYLYDAEGSPIGMQYRNDTMSSGTFYTFWFEKNLQGDIIAVYNSSGTKCVSYVYDAWGNVTVVPVNISETNINRVKAAQNLATNLQIGYIGGRRIARREIK